MSKLPPHALLLAALAGSIAVIVADAPMLIIGLGALPLLVVLGSAAGRRTFARRLLVTAPLVGVAVLLRWFGHVPARDSLLPVLRVVCAVAWSSWLSTVLAAQEIRTALRSLGVPTALVELIAHTHRFAVQLAATATEAWNAATLRAGSRTVRATHRTVGLVAGVIVARAFDRAESVAIAAALRGRYLADDSLPEVCATAQGQGVHP
ncbi:MAG TPA: energy-coupling factor transporter transmembrane component T [Polyangiaceae bacterium]|nr:energy-coupling factor transporter transmembrane component T [Polyangiaceae bacterium]